jgi:tight adherence protein B
MWVIYALIFGAALLGVQGLMLVLRSRKTEKSVNRRLVLTAEGASPSAVLETLRRERGFADLDNATLKRLSDFWTQTGLRFDRNTLVLSAFGLGAFFFLVFSALLGFGFVSLLLGTISAAGSMYFFLVSVRSRRIARFTEQLPDAIEVICRGVKVGYPFSSALALVAREMPDPIGTEFGMTADETTFGLDIGVALDNLYRRVGQEDLLFLIIAISIQSQTGGKLADILSRLAKLIRQRANLRLKVKALSAEGRLSGIFLSLMPFILIGVISLLSPSYFGSVLNHPLLMPAAVFGLTLLGIGNFIMYRMVNFKY